MREDMAFWNVLEGEAWNYLLPVLLETRRESFRGHNLYGQNDRYEVMARKMYVDDTGCVTTPYGPVSRSLDTTKV